MVEHSFTKLSQNMCKTNTNILMNRHARCDLMFWVTRLDSISFFFHTLLTSIHVLSNVSGLSINVCRFHSFFWIRNIFGIDISNFLMYNIILKEIVCCQYLYTFLGSTKSQKKLLFSLYYVKNYEEKSKNIFRRKNRSNTKFCLFKGDLKKNRKIGQI